MTPLYLIYWLAFMSIITFVFYAYDKQRAGAGGWRVPERRLHLLALAGGFPGAWFAMFALRHKTRKSIFKVVLFFATVAYALLFWYLLS